MTARRFLSCIVMVLLAGCTAITVREPDTATVGCRIEAKGFGKALAALEARTGSDASGADTETLRDRVRSLAAHYEETVIRETWRRHAAGDWPGGFGVLNEALARLPDSTRLRQPSSNSGDVSGSVSTSSSGSCS